MATQNSKTSGAIFDATGAYRYALWRVWDTARPCSRRSRDCVAAFVMLNPSTADATRDDPTIRRCIGFARDWGFGGVRVVNLFAYCTPSPAALRRAAVDPIGPENAAFLRDAAQTAGMVIAAWGNHGAWQEQDKAARNLFAELGVTPRCLSVTRAGQPRHPLYAPKNTAPVEYVFNVRSDAQ